MKIIQPKFIELKCIVVMDETTTIITISGMGSEREETTTYEFKKEEEIKIIKISDILEIRESDGYYFIHTFKHQLSVNKGDYNNIKDILMNKPNELCEIYGENND
jgi:DNA-binding LytR/AlgR family response regulator